MIRMILCILVLAACSAGSPPEATSSDNTPEADTVKQLVRTDAEWKQILDPDVYHILREKGTEIPFAGSLNDEKRVGQFRCAGCGHALFDSHTKFESGSGWPSFWDPANGKAVKLVQDASSGMSRVEVTCGRCGGHLGHVFGDGPRPTGKRYCINSLALKFTHIPEKKEE